MNKKRIIEFVKENFSNNRTKLVPLLKEFQWDKSVLKEINSKILQNIKRPISPKIDLSDFEKEKLQEYLVDTDELCDISDFYTIVLNPEITFVDDWDFEELIKQDKEIHFCRLWINWFLPYFYIETNYEKGINNGTFYQLGPLKKHNEHENSIIQEIKNILHSFNYSLCEFDFLTQTYSGLKTDLKDEDVSLFDCLFSDFYYYWNKHIKSNNGIINDPYDSNLTIGIKEYLDDNFDLIRKERTLYYNIFGYTTIVTNKNNEVNEIICRGYIDGIAGNKKVIKIGK